MSDCLSGARELPSRLGLSEESRGHGVLHTRGCGSIWVDSVSRWTKGRTHSNTQNIFRALLLAKHLHVSDLLYLTSSHYKESEDAIPVSQRRSLGLRKVEWFAHGVMWLGFLLSTLYTCLESSQESALHGAEDELGGMTDRCWLLTPSCSLSPLGPVFSPLLGSVREGCAQCLG